MESCNPLVSIVVLTFNQYETTTRGCLESLLVTTDPRLHEIVVVDNASADETRHKLIGLEKRHSHVRIHLNDINKGYAGGNNDGIRMSRGRFLVLLNNDTLVPQGWLTDLLQPFESNPELGMVGPITNSAGNEQCVKLPGLTESNYEEVAAAYTARHKGAVFPVGRLGFFCVAMRREVVQRTGLLDESFGLGMFEDDDYSLRAVQAGFRLAVTEGCFIYHKGNQSFKRLPRKDYDRLFESNRYKYWAKHDTPWTYSDMALAYLDRFSKELCEAGPKDVDLHTERLLVRLANFSDLLTYIRNLEAVSFYERTRWRLRRITRGLSRRLFRKNLGGRVR